MLNDKEEEVSELSLAVNQTSTYTQRSKRSLDFLEVTDFSCFHSELVCLPVFKLISLVVYRRLERD